MNKSSRTVLFVIGLLLWHDGLKQMQENSGSYDMSDINVKAERTAERQDAAVQFISGLLFIIGGSPLFRRKSGLDHEIN